MTIGRKIESCKPPFHVHVSKTWMKKFASLSNVDPVRGIAWRPDRVGGCICSAAARIFCRRATFISIANQIPDLTLIAVGMTLVLIVGGIDLSVGSVLALSSAVLGALMVDHD